MSVTCRNGWRPHAKPDGEASFARKDEVNAADIITEVATSDARWSSSGLSSLDDGRLLRSPARGLNPPTIY